MAEAVASYLDRYAEPEVKLALHLAMPQVTHCLVVPARGEAIDTLPNLLGLQSQSVLLILVCNSPDSMPAGTGLLSRAVRALPETARWAHLSLHTYRPGQFILLVDRESKNLQLPVKQGVGLARKIGADLACSFIDRGLVRNPLIFNSDADVRLPADFLQLNEDRGLAARLYPFVHLPEPGLELSCALYELSLRYYVQGLTSAGSAYAHHAIGSTIAIDQRSYARVRGFPRRAAGEDFYMLNKLAKVGRIRSISGPVIRIEGRLSDRVPFGTGTAIGALQDSRNPWGAMRFYQPTVFLALRHWLLVLHSSWNSSDQASAQGFAGTGALRQPLQAYAGVIALSDKISAGRRQYRSETSYRSYIDQWFDGFATLKFIHYMRDHYFPSLSPAKLLIDPLLQDVDPGMSPALRGLAPNQEESSDD